MEILINEKNNAIANNIINHAITFEFLAKKIETIIDVINNIDEIFLIIFNKFIIIYFY